MESDIKIKLFTLWMLDQWCLQTEPHSHIISCGIWEAFGVTETSVGRVYDFRCVWPMHPDLQRGNERKMYEGAIIILCHQVEINHLAKIEHPFNKRHSLNFKPITNGK